MIKHLVVLNWKEETTAEQINAVGQGFEELKGAIAGIVNYEFGPNAGFYDHTGDYGLVAEFSSEEDFRAYVDDVKHQAFMKEVISPILESYSAVQFVMEQ